MSEVPLYSLDPTEHLLLTLTQVRFYTRLLDSRRSAVRAEDAQGTRTQSHVSPSILVSEDEKTT